jgi:homocysteine S-methyltransferase
VRYRDALPQLAGGPFLTDGGIETVLIDRGVDLPEFAAFDVLRRPGGEAVLRDYYGPFLAIGREHGTGFVLSAPTWRASPDWAAALGYDEAGLAGALRQAVDLVDRVRRDEGDGRAIVLEAQVGPRRDEPGTMTAAVAERYHAPALRVLADTAVDMVTALTIGDVDEAIGIVRAAAAVHLPVAVSFTVGEDGRLPAGDAVADAIARVDRATEGAPVHFLLNCSQPAAIAAALAAGGPWLARLAGLRPNTTAAPLDGSPVGDPVAFGRELHALAARLPRLAVIGGCCGTDERHVASAFAALDGAG